MKQVAIYAYKNVPVTGREVQTQIDECTRYAERMGFEIVKVYADTGTRQQRTKLLKDSQNGKFSGVICTTQDRMGRYDHIHILQKLYEYGIVLYYTNGTDTTDYFTFLDKLRKTYGGHHEK